MVYVSMMIQADRIIDMKPTMTIPEAVFTKELSQVLGFFSFV